PTVLLVRRRKEEANVLGEESRRRCAGRRADGHRYEPGDRGSGRGRRREVRVQGRGEPGPGPAQGHVVVQEVRIRQEGEQAPRQAGVRRRPWAGHPALGAVDALRAVEEAGAEVDREVRVQQLHPVLERADEGLTAGPAYGRGRRTRGGAAAPAVFPG